MLSKSGRLDMPYNHEGCGVVPVQVVIDDDEDEDASDAIEASEESSWLTARGPKPSGQEASTRDPGKGSKQRTITSLLPKLPLGADNIQLLIVLLSSQDAAVCMGVLSTCISSSMTWQVLC